MQTFKLIEDYIFYRVWHAYKKDNRFETTDTRIFITLLRTLQMFPLMYIAIAVLIGENKDALIFGWILVGAINYYLVAKKYNKEYRYAVFKKYSKSKYNKIIPTWIFFTLHFIYIIVAIVLCIVAIKYVITPYNSKC